MAVEFSLAKTFGIKNAGDIDTVHFACFSEENSSMLADALLAKAREQADHSDMPTAREFQKAAYTLNALKSLADVLGDPDEGYNSVEAEKSILENAIAA